MAFTNQNQTNTSSANFEKATAFLNIYTVSADGKKVKVGALPLKNSRKYDAALIKRLSGDPAALEKMKAVIQLDFQMVTDTPLSDDALGF